MDLGDPHEKNPIVQDLLAVADEHRRRSGHDATLAAFVLAIAIVIKQGPNRTRRDAVKACAKMIGESVDDRRIKAPRRT
jgi:hypothetical protein